MTVIILNPIQVSMVILMRLLKFPRTPNRLFFLLSCGRRPCCNHSASKLAISESKERLWLPAAQLRPNSKLRWNEKQFFLLAAERGRGPDHLLPERVAAGRFFSAIYAHRETYGLYVI